MSIVAESKQFLLTQDSLGWLDDSAAKGICGQAGRPEFISCGAHGGRKELSRESYPLTSTGVLL